MKFWCINVLFLLKPKGSFGEQAAWASKRLNVFGTYENSKEHADGTVFGTREEQGLLKISGTKEEKGLAFKVYGKRCIHCNPFRLNYC